MKKMLKSAVAVASALGLAGCPGPDNGFPQPENTVAINFSIDASGRPDFYADKDLEWKGSFTYNETTRMLTYDSSWGGGTGPYVPLYDDGPWSEGGHEPEGEEAGDDVFGATVFLEIPADEAVTIEYGAQTKEGGWIWPGASNGSLEVPVGQTTALTAEGFDLSSAGNVDARITLDTNNLGSGHTFTAGTAVTVKGTFYLPNPWSNRTAYDDGTHGDATANDGIYTFVVSADTTDSRGVLLLASGSPYEFIWNLGSTEYKTSGGEGETTGVTVGTRSGTTGNFTTAAVTINSKGNPQFTAP